MAEAVAGWLVCPLIKVVVDKAKSCASDKIKWLSGGIPDALNQLDRMLTELRAVASAVERSRGGGARGGKDDLDRWIVLLKEAVYEADDIVDEFCYRRLLRPDSKVSAARSTVAKFGKQFAGTDEPLNRLKGVVKKLESIMASSAQLMQAAELEASSRFGELSLSGHHLISDGSVTGSLLEDGEVVGRDAERKDMVSWLVSGSPPNGAERCAATIPVAAITGLGGMGKTTLARVLCHDESVKATFDLIMWVSPPANCDKVGLVKELLQAAGVQLPNDMKSFDWLQRRLEEVVSSRKFLLVLDNIWYKEEMNDSAYRDMWSEVLAPLRCDQPGSNTGSQLRSKHGSKIVVTTRKKIVADKLNASKRVLLNGLAPADVWLLFKKNAFSSDNIDNYPALQAIGEKLVTKLKGLPLAAKVVGRMLQSKLSTTEWKKILEMEIYDDVQTVLELCYRNLPEHLQPCFAICSIFPKNRRFKRDKLVKIWMALDFIQPKKDDVKKELEEDVGKRYFNQLVERSFFHERKEGRRNYYYIHDLMHDLAEEVSRNDCARVESVEKKDIPCTVRHLSVSSDVVMQLKGQYDLKRLRTFIVLKHSTSSLGQLPEDIVKELKCVRVLGLDGCDMVDLSERVGHLIHLRYLALCKTITKVPQSVTKLLFLQTLSIPRKCHLEFPKDMRNLKYLRHLDMDRASTSKVPGIGELTHLQGSIEFHVKKEKGHTLPDLHDMKDLRRKLHIKNLDVVASKEEACKAGLRDKKSIKVLELEWNSSGKSDSFVDAEVLEGLEPHPHVEEVRIRRYPGTTSPRWLDMSFKDDTLCLLKSLYLTNCRKWQVLPPLGQLPFLKVLHLKEMCSLRKIGSDFYGTNSIAFPCLEDLGFDDMPEWVEWTKEDKGIGVFPRLRKLKLLDCPKLVEMPSLSLSVRKVTIENTGFISHLKLSTSSSSSKPCNALETTSTSVLADGLLNQQQVESIAILTLRRCQDVKFQELDALTSLKRLEISHLDLTDEQLGTYLRVLQSLTFLEIANCSNITGLPHIENPSCLTTLQIRQCSALSSLHHLPNFVTLETLLIENCSKLTVESFPANFNGISSLRRLSIMYCTELESLPSGFPCSLQVLDLVGCKPALLNKLQLKDGPEWDKVDCIPIKRIH